jgi:hypothetical protein
MWEVYTYSSGVISFFSITVQLSKNAFIMACAKNGVNLSKPILLAISETACEVGLSECYELWGSEEAANFMTV